MIAEISRPDEKNSPPAVAAMERRLIATANALPEIYRQTRVYYDHFFDNRLTIHTPDPHFDAAMQWAEIAIDQAKVRTDNETSLVAGWYPSFDSTRPGFGWYFGRDALWTLYAVNSYGDETLAKQVLEFLAKRQRADGKMMHEFSLTADNLHGDFNWATLGYEYAAADATPLFIMAVADYVRTTGDLDFLRVHWNELKKAYEIRPWPPARQLSQNTSLKSSQATGRVTGPMLSAATAMAALTRLQQSFLPSLYGRKKTLSSRRTRCSHCGPHITSLLTGASAR